MPSLSKPRRLAAAAAVAAAAATAYSVLVEPRWLQRTWTRVGVADLHPGLRGFRIALLTDLHLGGGTTRGTVRRACRMAMAARPHLVALTGDLASEGARARRLGELTAELSALSAPCGVFAVPGNHDHRLGIDAWRRVVRSLDEVTDLTNRAVFVEVGEAMLCVAGVDDLDEGSPDLSAAIPAEARRDFTLLLAHNPDQAERARRSCDGIDLVVSGHTHGGQIRLPWLGALRNPAARDHLYDQGLLRRPWTQVYVSRGVGTVHVPMRFLCRPEVAILELVAGDPGAAPGEAQPPGLTG
jgi:uncharacterized protein